MSVIILTTGQPGAGKSYSRVRWLVSDFLVNCEGLYITNLPLNVEEIASDLATSTGKDYDYYLNRIIVIPDEELKAWRDLALLDKNLLKEIKDDCGFRPAEFFDNYELQGAHIAIDEFHRYCSKSDPILLRKVWNDWFAEVRKLGCTFEAITQDISQLPRDFYGKVGVKIDLAPFGDTLDPFLGIKMYDWYQLKGGITGDLVTAVEQVESIKDVSNSGSISWKEIKHNRFRIDGKYFKYYNSFQKSDNSDKVQAFDCPATLLKWRVIFWFIRRNFFKLLWKLLILIGAIWLICFGGIQSLITGFTSSLNHAASSNTPTQKTAISSQNRRTENEIYQNSSDSSITFFNPQDYQPALFFNNQIILRNGLHVHQNYTFKNGFFKDKQITSINKELRLIIIDDRYSFGMFDVLPEFSKSESKAF